MDTMEKQSFKSNSFDEQIAEINKNDRIHQLVSDKLGNYLEFIRKERKMTTSEFYTLLKLSQSYYSEIINKKKIPNLLVLEKICLNLNTPLYDFILSMMFEYSQDNERKELILKVKPSFDRIEERLLAIEQSNNN